MAEAVLALGGNVGSESEIRDRLDNAIALLCADEAVRLTARSSDYRTPPWGVENQAPFVNCVIAIVTNLPPLELLDRAQAIEDAFGRNRARERRWGPRTLDIDLIDYDGIEFDTPRLTLPHPRAFQRAFVLVPLAEIAPEMRIGRIPVSTALARTDPAGIKKLPPRPTS